MLIAADYPFLDVLWTMIIFFFWVIWIWIADHRASATSSAAHDIGGWDKAAG